MGGADAGADAGAGSGRAAEDGVEGVERGARGGVGRWGAGGEARDVHGDELRNRIDKGRKGGKDEGQGWMGGGYIVAPPAMHAAFYSPAMHA